jgi:adenine-specific DNA-methyltransferase
MTNFSKLTELVLKDLTKDEKKQHGIFFTPKSYRVKLLEYLDSLNVQPTRILEPSFGSGEFLMDVFEKYPRASITGVELNSSMHEKVYDHMKCYTNIELFHENFLDFESDTKFDLIIGNPPYVVVKDVRPEYEAIATGRPNLYCWFIYKCIGMLEENGYLAFVIPNSFLNASYYEPLRKYVLKTCEILNIIEYHKQKTDFQDTEQATIGIVLKKEKSSGEQKYVVEHDGHVFFNANFLDIRAMLSRGTSLKELGFSVKTGTVVWNNHKDHLVDEDELEACADAKALVYSTNIKDGRWKTLNQKNGKKQFFSNSKGEKRQAKVPFVAPVILMNRGFGNTIYNPEMMFVEGSILGHNEFFVENHLNVIQPLTDSARELMGKVFDCLQSDGTKDFISKFSGNGALSKTEIESILPICLEESN